MGSKMISILMLAMPIALIPVIVFGFPVSPDSISEKSKAQRFPDPVIIKAETFPAMSNRALGNYRLYACREDGFEPIRFQIDEMTEEGDFIFPHGRESNKELSNGILDSRDVLLFMAHDAGDRVSENGWPKKADIGTEIEVIDPTDQSRSWTYLFYFENDPPPLCPLPDYFHYDVENESLWSEYWKQQYHKDEKGKTTNYFDYFCVLPKAGGNGKNFADRLKVRATAKLFFGRITLNINEESMKSNVLHTWIQGPIRVVRRVEHYGKGPFGMKLFRIISDVYYYETMSTCPIHVGFPFKVERVMTSLYLQIGSDYSPEVKGSTFYNSNNPQGVKINGRMDESEERFNPAPDRWRVMTGNWGTLMTRSVLTPEAEEYLEIVQGVTDDETMADPPETYPGNMGWTWQRWRIGQLPGGHYTFYLEFYVPPHYQSGDEVAYMNYLDHPLGIKVGGKTYENQTKLFGEPGKGF